MSRNIYMIEQTKQIFNSLLFSFNNIKTCQIAFFKKGSTQILTIMNTSELDLYKGWNMNTITVLDWI